MPRATGPIGYIEHRSPRKDENGKYIIHPQFVQKEMYDAEKMAHDSQGRCMTNGAQFVSVMDTLRRSPSKLWAGYSCHFRKRISC